MPRNGNGGYVQPVPDPQPNTLIRSADVNSWLGDLGGEVTNSLAKDGQTTPIANLPMGGFRHTGVGGAVARDQYLSMGQGQDGAATWRGTAGGTANAITLSSSPASASYTAGETHTFIASANNTDAVTVDVNGLGAKALAAVTGTALPANTILAGRIVTIVYDGTGFVLDSVGLAPAVFVRSQTASAVSAIDFTLPGGFWVYKITIGGVIVSINNVAIGMRFSTNGGASFFSGASDYQYRQIWNPTATTLSAGTGSISSLPLAIAMTDSSTVIGEYMLFRGDAVRNASILGMTTGIAHDGGSGYGNVGVFAGRFNTAVAINAIRVFTSSSTLSGTISISGVR